MNGIHSFEIRESHPAGDSCANVITLSNKLPDGTVLPSPAGVFPRFVEA